MQNPFSRALIDSKGKEFQKSEIGLQIERSDTSSDRVCHACARKNKTSLFHLLGPAERKASDRRS